MPLLLKPTPEVSERMRRVATEDDLYEFTQFISITPWAKSKATLRTPLSHADVAWPAGETANAGNTTNLLGGAGGFRGAGS